MATKHSKEIHQRAKKLGDYLADGGKARNGIIRTARAAREAEWRMGKLGPASGVRKIDPVTGEVIQEISPRQIAAQKAAQSKATPAKLAKRKSRRQLEKDWRDTAEWRSPLLETRKDH